jgi:LysM domain/Penicillin-insensitive murein endopeptidase
MPGRHFALALVASCAAVCAGCRPTAVSDVPRGGPPAAATTDQVSSESPTAKPAPSEEDKLATAEPEDTDESEEGLDDEFDSQPPPDATILPPHPLASVSDDDVARRIQKDAASLGPMSIGKPSAGLLFNGVPMPAGDGWSLVDPSHAWGTDETVGYIQAAISSVVRSYSDSPKLMIGHISGKDGGYLKPHLSHQSGRDVDLGYYYVGGSRWYQRADAQNLDRERTWALVRALVTQTDLELLLIDRSIQVLLADYAEGKGEDKEWVRLLFHGNGILPPLIRHAPGHATHLHARFYNPIATETGRRCYAALLRQGYVRPGAAFVTHVAKKGETLAELAKRYGTTVRAIRRANGLKSTVIQAKKAYKIPQSGHAPPALSAGPVGIPPRRLPPKGA